MDARVHDRSSPEDECATPFLLAGIKVGATDKLGHIIQDVLWCGADYTVYRSDKGVYVHFSDCPDREKKQREAFAEIAPELCELRVFTSQMQRDQQQLKRWSSWLPWRSPDNELFNHNIAQSLMLTMEGKIDKAKVIVGAALGMAIRRSTNDNTIRYVVACVIVAAVWIAIALVAMRFNGYVLANASAEAFNYCVASIFGALGAVFSILTRVEAFEMKPCQQSNMNYWMSGIRVGIGVVGGVMLVLLATNFGTSSIFSQNAVQLLTSMNWQIAAIFGFIGGFSERFVKTLLRRTTDAVVTAGTPVEEAKRSEMIARG